MRSLERELRKIKKLGGAYPIDSVELNHESGIYLDKARKIRDKHPYNWSYIRFSDGLDRPWVFELDGAPADKVEAEITHRNSDRVNTGRTKIICYPELSYLDILLRRKDSLGGKSTTRYKLLSDVGLKGVRFHKLQTSYSALDQSDVQLAILSLRFMRTELEYFEQVV